METQAISLFVTAALNLTLALIVYSKGRNNPVTRPYAAAVLSVALWAFGHGMYALSGPQTALLWFYFTYLAGAFIATHFFHFTRVFPNPTEPTNLIWPARLLSFGFPGVVLIGFLSPNLLIQSLTFTDGVKEVAFVKPTLILYNLSFSILMGWGFFNLLTRYGKSAGRQKMQIRYVVAGTGVAWLFGSYFNLMLPWRGDTGLMWLGPHFSIIMIGFIAYAIVKHRLMDIRLILGRTIFYSLLLACTLALYTMLILLAQRFFQDKTGYITSLVIGSLFIALGFEPLRKFFQKATERIFFKRELDPQHLLAVLSEIFSSTRDLDKLLRTTSEELTHAFRTDHAIMVALQDHGELSVGISGEKTTLATPFHTDHPLVQFYASSAPGEYIKMPPKRESQLYEELVEIDYPAFVMDEGTRTRLVAAMERDHIGVVVPIFTEEQFSGLLLLGHKKSGESFFPADLKLLEIISQQAGVAIENARLYRTLQRQMEELKQSQAQQLIQSAKLASIGELAINVAHEINNPLTSILGFTSLLLEDMDENDSRKKDLRIIENETIRSREIVRNLLDFARKRGFKKEPTDINHLIQQTLSLLRNQAEVSNIFIKENYSTDLPKVEVDPNQMKQVFINLLKNAFDAMPKGGTLTIMTSDHASGESRASAQMPGKGSAPLTSKMIEIRFMDTGIGIARENIPRIFEPFFTTKEDGGGTGLGLAVSYGIIERHSGRLEVSCQEGAGTTFIIKLPVKEEIPLSRLGR